MSGRLGGTCREARSLRVYSHCPRVAVAVLFARYRGLFLLHCHNLDHEDMGMMASVVIV